MTDNIGISQGFNPNTEQMQEGLLRNLFAKIRCNLNYKIYL